MVSELYFLVEVSITVFFLIWNSIHAVAEEPNATILPVYILCVWTDEAIVIVVYHRWIAYCMWAVRIIPSSANTAQLFHNHLYVQSASGGAENSSHLSMTVTNIS